jgi:hypothetical protein
MHAKQVVTPLLLEYFPASHSIQSMDVLAPTFVAYVPIVQNKQAELEFGTMLLFSSANVPGVQSVQLYAVPIMLVYFPS